MMAKSNAPAMPIYAFSCGKWEKECMYLWLMVITHILLILAGALLSSPQEKKQHYRHFFNSKIYQPRAGYPAVIHPT